VLRFPQYHLPVQNKVHLFIKTLKKKKTIGKGKFEINKRIIHRLKHTGVCAFIYA
jgi:hypothetical protein